MQIFRNRSTIAAVVTGPRFFRGDERVLRGAERLVATGRA